MLAYSSTCYAVNRYPKLNLLVVFLDVMLELAHPRLKEGMVETSPHPAMLDPWG